MSPLRAAPSGRSVGEAGLRFAPALVSPAGRLVEAPSCVRSGVAAPNAARLLRRAGSMVNLLKLKVLT